MNPEDFNELLKHRRYILMGHIPIPCYSLLQWAEWMQNSDRRVKLHKVKQRVRLEDGVVEMQQVNVSTVFLGIDHGFLGDAPPILFESMIFGGWADEYQIRYCTWADAVEGHYELLNKVRLECGLLPVEVEY